MFRFIGYTHNTARGYDQIHNFLTQCSLCLCVCVVADSRFLDTPALARLCRAAVFLAWPSDEAAEPPAEERGVVLSPIIQRGVVWTSWPSSASIESALTDRQRAQCAHVVLTELCLRNRDRLGYVILYF